MTLGMSASGSSSRAAARRASRLAWSWSLPDLEDRVGVEVVERAQPDQLVVALGAQRPVVAGVGDGLRDPGAVRLQRDVGAGDRAARAASSSGPSMTPSAARRGPPRTATAGRRRSGPPCAARSRPACPTARVLTLLAGTPGAASSRSAIRARRSASGAAPRANSRNTASPSSPADRAAALPAPDLVGLVQVEAEVVELEVALEPGRRGEAGVVQRLDRGEVRAVRGDLVETASRLASPSRESSVWMPRYVARIGLSTSSRRTRVSTRSYRRSSSGPAIRGAAAGRGSAMAVSWSVIGPPAAAMRAGASRRW